GDGDGDGDGDMMGDGDGDGDCDGTGGVLGDGDGDGTGGALGGGGMGGMSGTNECATDNGGCDEVCTDTEDGHSCGCLPGGKLNSDGVSCDPLAVLYLGDAGDNASTIYDYLVAEGFDVTDAAPFYEWDGVSPDVNDFDVVVYLEGHDYGEVLLEDANTALSAWMLAGGTVIRSEWIAFVLSDEVELQTDFDQYLPVQAPDSDYDYSPQWT